MPLGLGTDIASGLDTSSATPTTERFEYDARGRQILHVSFEGVVTTMVYDEYSRMSERRFYSSEDAYDNGNGTPDEAWTYTRDAYGREIEVKQTLFTAPRELTGEGPEVRGFAQDRTPLAEPVVRTSTKQYDDQGRWTAHITPEGRINYEYDDLGRKTLMSVGDPASPDRSTEYGYDELGRLSSVTERDFIGETNVSTPQATAQTELTAKYFYDL